MKNWGLKIPKNGIQGKKIVLRAKSGQKKRLFCPEI